MELLVALIVLGAIVVLGVSAFLIVRGVKAYKAKRERERQEAEAKAKAKAEAEAAFHKRVKKLVDDEFSKLPAGGSVEVTYSWYQRIGFLGPWKKMSRTEYLDVTPGVVYAAAYYYLKALDEGEINPRRFKRQIDLVLFVQNNVEKLWVVNYY